MTWLMRSTSSPRDAETYVHRIGRTGRAGRRGTAILLLSPRDRRTLRNISDNTKQRIDPMEIPSAKKLNQVRILRFADEIGAILGDESTRQYREILSKILSANKNYSAFDVAAALAAMLRKERPLLLEELPAAELRTRNKAAGLRPSLVKKKRRNKAPRPGDENMERYAVQVGSTHGLNPSHLVGAIANEADLSSKYIGRIEIFSAYSTVDLPMGMPEETYRLLKKVKVCNRPLKLRKVTPDRGASL